MSKLLRANFARLWKDKTFILGMVFMLVLGIYAVSGTMIENSRYPEEAVSSLDHILLDGGIYAFIANVIFTAFYVGTEYSDGTMRNKIAAGHSRLWVYFANWTVCTAAAFMMHLLYITVVVIGGCAFIGPFAVSLPEMAKLIISSLIPIAALNSIFTAAAMLVHSKPAAVTTVILMSFALTFYGMIVQSRLNEPEYYEAYSWTDEDGVTHNMPREKNLSYPTGAKRKYYELALDILPTCQLQQISSMSAEASENGGRLTKGNNTDLIVFTGYSVLIITTALGAGVLFFKRKDLK